MTAYLFQCLMGRPVGPESIRAILEIGFKDRLQNQQRGHSVGDSYMLLTRPSPQLSTVELRFQFRYAAAQPPRLLDLNPQTLWFSSSGQSPAAETPRRKVEKADVTQALAGLGQQARYSQLREQIMELAVAT